MSPLEIARILETGSPEVDRYLGEEIYVNDDPQYLANQRQRLAETVRLHAERVGDKPTFLLRAPGRLNAFLEYLDVCAGDHMSTTIDGDIPVAVSIRNDGVVSAANSSKLFKAEDFSITEEFELFSSAPWTCSAAKGLADNWDNRTRVYPHYNRPQGDWVNYIRAAFLRVAAECPNVELTGVDLTFGPPTAPFRAGTSSSSAIVVLSFLALCLANEDKLPKWQISKICKMLGEAEWYVGTHGGANDQTTILRNHANGVLYNRHSAPELDSTPLQFLKGVRIVLANSLWEVNKALCARHTFNLRKGWTDLGNDLLRLIIVRVRDYQKDKTEFKLGWLNKLMLTEFGFVPGGPISILEEDPNIWETIETNYAYLGSLSERLLGVSNEAIEELINLLPAEIMPEHAATLLDKDLTALQRDYWMPNAEDGGYKVRSAASFFFKENLIGEELENIFTEADEKLKSGELTEISDEYDAYRVKVGNLVEDLQDTLRDDFQVSNGQLNLLLDIAKKGPGYLGGKLTGAGNGGCVSILVRQGQEQAFCDHIDREYYGKREHFEAYLKTLDDLEKRSDPCTPHYFAADEMRQNLDRALSSIKCQRQVITFSKGACVLELPNS